MNKAVISVVAVVVLAVGGFLVFHKSDKSSSETNAPASSTPAATTPASTAPAASGTNQKAIATIAYVNNGFSPSSLTVKAGDKVTFKNTSSQAIQVQSNPHPTHTDDQDLNVGVIASGQSITITVSQTGTFGYHNHLDSSQGGSITIQ